MLAVKIIENKKTYNAQELRLCSFSAGVILTSFTPSTFSVHSSTNLSIKFFSTLAVFVV